MGYYRSDATGKLTKYAGSNNRGYMPLGMIFASSVELEELTVKCLNGQNLSINGPYNQFCYWLMDKGSKAPTCDIATYATEIASYGQCGKYVINNTATAQTSGNYTVPAYSIKLPTITEFVASNNGGDAIGLAELDMFKSHSHPQFMAYTQTANNSNAALMGYPNYEYRTPDGTAIGGEETRPKNIRYPFYVVVAQGVRLQALIDVEKKAEKDASNLSEGDVEKWQEKLGASVLVAECTVNTATNSIIIDGLDILADGGVYDFVFQGGSSTWNNIWLDVNDGGYTFYRVENGGIGYRTSSGELSTSMYVEFGYDYAFLGGAANVCGSGVKGVIVLTNNQELKIYAENGVFVNGYQRHVNIYNAAGSVDNIKKLKVTMHDANFTVGTTLKIYKRANNVATRYPV